MNSRQAPGPTTLGSLTSLSTDATAAKFPLVIRSGLLLQVVTARQDADSQMILSLRRFKDDHDWKTAMRHRRFPQDSTPTSTGQQGLTSTVERLATESYNQLKPPRQDRLKYLKYRRRKSRLMKTQFGIQSQSTKLPRSHQQNTENQNLCTCQTNQSTNEKTKSMRQKKRLSQKKSLARRASSQSIQSCSCGQGS